MNIFLFLVLPIIAFGIIALAFVAIYDFVINRKK
jgi:hypothetical protein